MVLILVDDANFNSNHMVLLMQQFIFQSHQSSFVLTIQIVRNTTISIICSGLNPQGISGMVYMGDVWRKRSWSYPTWTKQPSSFGVLYICLKRILQRETASAAASNKNLNINLLANTSLETLLHLQYGLQLIMFYVHSRSSILADIIHRYTIAVDAWAFSLCEGCQHSIAPCIPSTDYTLITFITSITFAITVIQMIVMRTTPW